MSGNGRWRTIGRDSEKGRKGVLHRKSKKETKGRGKFTCSQLSLLKIQARDFLKIYCIMSNNTAKCTGTVFNRKEKGLKDFSYILKNALIIETIEEEFEYVQFSIL